MAKKQIRKQNEQLLASRVDSWKQFLVAVKTAERRLGREKDEELWFRGVSSNDYKLLPSLQRHAKNKQLSRSDLCDLESNLFFEFLSKARTGQVALDHWDALFLMQHYRAPTRLLDWTEVLFVALYFALSDPSANPASIPRVYVMNPYLWNESHKWGRELWWPRYFGWDAKEDHCYEYGEILVEGGADWKFPICLYPPQREARLSAQRGFFTLHGFDDRPLDEIAPQVIAAIDLGPNAVKECQEMLDSSGMDDYTLFPDLEGLTRSLKRKYGIG